MSHTEHTAVACMPLDKHLKYTESQVPCKDVAVSLNQHGTLCLGRAIFIMLRLPKQPIAHWFAMHSTTFADRCDSQLVHCLSYRSFFQLQHPACNHTMCDWHAAVSPSIQSLLCESHIHTKSAKLPDSLFVVMLNTTEHTSRVGEYVS